MAAQTISDVSLFIDISVVYSNTTLHLAIIANKGFITTLCASASSYLLYILVKKDPNPEIYGIAVRKELFRVFAFILLFMAGLLEINHQFSYYYPDADLNILYLMLYVPVFVSLFNLISAKVNGADFNWVLSFVLLACAVALYLALSPVYFSQLQTMLEHPKVSPSHFAAHWLSDLFIAFVFYQLVSLCRDKFDADMKGTAAWILSTAIVLFLSLELCLVSELLFYSKDNTVDVIQTVYIKTALPILWGVSSFILMWLGMRNKQRNLRIISLSLFLLTLIKLFLFDINNIPVAGKIAAFFCLGVLLLIISFMYQKVKKIIVDDEDKSKD